MSNPRSTTPFFGRAFSLAITTNPGLPSERTIIISSDSFEPEALKFTFEISQYAWSAFWQAEITIWNANGPIGGNGPDKDVNLYKTVIN